MDVTSTVLTVAGLGIFESITSIDNAIGAIVVRQLTIYNLDKIKQYIYLKNGAMYSVLVLGFVMLAPG